MSGAVNQTIELLLLSCYYLPWLWGRADAASQALAGHISWYRHSELAVTIIFFLLDGAKDVALGLPFSWYRTFVLEEKHGFNKQTLRLFFLDTVKSVRPMHALLPSALHRSSFCH